MPWRRAATVVLDSEGHYLDADATALELMGVGSVEELRALAPETFAALPPDPEEQRAWREAYFASRAEGVLAEMAFRRLDGEFVRIRLAILDLGDDRYRALFYPIERPTTDLTARVYRIAEVLSEWRQAERQLVELDPESEEARLITEDIELLREQHQVLFDEILRRRGTIPT
jgi:PAS domain-containing protein